MISRPFLFFDQLLFRIIIWRFSLYANSDFFGLITRFDFSIPNSSFNLSSFPYETISAFFSINRTAFIGFDNWL
ncbi:hypothetical protein D0X99_18230 [Algoriphagus lacus]|uniref:Uncharacterized protein n=1 Tax=Algoriphagus lacus TaxID=2056311 RepID=A0A418PM89_9BACT|nr:hypothetical protein D0X99_18230 [Algoriphagus lacus]